jgi:hypothetical protein
MCGALQTVLSFLLVGDTITLCNICSSLIVPSGCFSFGSLSIRKFYTWLGVIITFMPNNLPPGREVVYRLVPVIHPVDNPNTTPQVRPLDPTDSNLIVPGHYTVFGCECRIVSQLTDCRSLTWCNPGQMTAETWPFYAMWPSEHKQVYPFEGEERVAMQAEHKRRRSKNRQLPQETRIFER